MIKFFFDFSYKRNFLHAFGFYVVYLIAVSLFVAIVGAYIQGLLGHSGDFAYGRMNGARITTVILLVMSFLILRQKNRIRSIKHWAIALLSSTSFFFGGVVGLVFVSYLTTVDPRIIEST